jgi:hypothetical protein
LLRRAGNPFIFGPMVATKFNLSLSPRFSGLLLARPLLRLAR